MLLFRQLIAAIDSSQYVKQPLGETGNPQLGKLLANIASVECLSRRHGYDDISHHADTRPVVPRVLPGVGDRVDELVLRERRRFFRVQRPGRQV